MAQAAPPPAPKAKGADVAAPPEPAGNPNVRNQFAMLPSGRKASKLLNGAISAHTSSIRSISLNPFFKDKFATASRDGVLKTWTMSAFGRASQAAEVQAHKGRINCVVWHPDGLICATASDDGVLKFFENGKEKHSIKTVGPAFSADVSLSGQHIAVGGFRNITIYDMETGQPVRSMDAHSLSVFSCRYHPASLSLLMSGGDDKLVKLWDIETGHSVQTFKDHKGWVRSTEFSDNGQFIVTCGDDRNVKAYYLGEKDPLHSFSEARGTVFAAAIHGNVVYAAGSDAKVRLYDMNSGQLENTLSGHVGAVYTLDFSSASSTLMTGGTDKHLMFWKLRDWLQQRNELKARAMVNAPTVTVVDADAVMAASDDSMYTYSYSGDSNDMGPSDDGSGNVEDKYLQRRPDGMFGRKPRAPKAAPPAPAASAPRAAGAGAKGAQALKQQQSPQTTAASKTAGKAPRTEAGGKGVSASSGPKKPAVAKGASPPRTRPAKGPPSGSSGKGRGSKSDGSGSGSPYQYKFSEEPSAKGKDARTGPAGGKTGRFVRSDRPPVGAHLLEERVGVGKIQDTVFSHSVMCVSLMRVYEPDARGNRGALVASVGSTLALKSVIRPSFRFAIGDAAYQTDDTPGGDSISWDDIFEFPEVHPPGVPLALQDMDLIITLRDAARGNVDVASTIVSLCSFDLQPRSPPVEVELCLDDDKGRTVAVVVARMQLEVDGEEVSGESRRLLYTEAGHIIDPQTVDYAAMRRPDSHSDARTTATAITGRTQSQATFYTDATYTDAGDARSTRSGRSTARSARSAGSGSQRSGSMRSGRTGDGDSLYSYSETPRTAPQPEGSSGALTQFNSSGMQQESSLGHSSTGLPGAPTVDDGLDDLDDDTPAIRDGEDFLPDIPAFRDDPVERPVYNDDNDPGAFTDPPDYRNSDLDASFLTGDPLGEYSGSLDPSGDEQRRERDACSVDSGDIDLGDEFG